ncbi:hypothetical protein ACUXCJ_001588 [Staphylococcus haemolyticus]|nr:hypothetical protein BDW31_10434 [Staphylococcus sp. AtHG25]
MVGVNMYNIQSEGSPLELLLNHLLVDKSVFER